MPALRSADKVSAHMVTRGTRAPGGLPPARSHGTEIYRDVPLWPGITWGDDSRCLCSWGYRKGARQVKVSSGACTVHVPGRKPAAAGPLAPAPSDEALLAAIRAGAVTWELYEASVRSWRQDHRASLLGAALGPVIGVLAEGLEPDDNRRCGTRRGRDRHVSEGTRVCPACRAADRDRRVRAPGGQPLGEAA